MVWRAPLRVGTQSVILLGRTICGLLDVGHGTANVIVCLSLTLFCLGLVLQALSNAADPYRCRALIRHGSWPPYAPLKVNAAADYEQLETLQREGREPPPARPFDKWEPAGCRMHEYSRDDIRECLGGKRVLFVGDTTMRVLFFAALTRLEHEVAEWLLRTTFTESNPRHDLAIDSETVHLHFIWDPWLNSTALDDEIRMMEPGGDKHAGTELKPDLVIIGSVGLWAARNAADDKYFDTFCTTTDRVTRVMGDEVRPFDGQHSANYVFLAPVTIPRYEMLRPGRAEAISPDRIKRMNNYLANVSPAVQSHILTSYNEMTNHIPEAYEDTGLHVTASVAERWIDIPLNARCNGLLLGRPVADQPVPSLVHTTTCCAAYPTPVRAQRLLWYILCAAIFVPTLIFVVKSRAALLASHLSCTFVGLAALYCYMADRSHAFAKSEKHYNVGWLCFVSVLSVIVFLVYQKRYVWKLRGPPPTSPHRPSLSEVDFLPRHISNEWKGLMQVAVLLLAYQDTTQTSIVVKWSGFFTASYLFLSAFGHASYFLRVNDFSFHRVASVLFRLNILPCLLALMLDGPDKGTANSVSRLYYFPRLISFWFLIIYITLRIGSHTNRSQPHLLLLRICVSATVLVYIGLHPGPFGLFETINKAGTYLFGKRTTWAVEDMSVAVYTNWCAPYVGMVVAVVAQRAAIICDRIQRQQEQEQMLLSGKFSESSVRPHTSTGPSTNGDAGWLDRVLIAVLYRTEFTTPIQTMIVIFSSVFFFMFASATSVSPLVEGDTSHPYITSVAVACFAVVRNCHSQLRARYMMVPAALGAMALELFVLHNHILLSGNGTGHLRLLSLYAPAVEEGASFLENVSRAKIATVHCVEIVSITVIFLLVARHTYKSTRFLSLLLFGDRAAEYTGHSPLPANMRGPVIGIDASIAAFDSGHYELPEYGDESSLTAAKEPAAIHLSPTTLGVQIRAASVLFLLWAFNQFYV
ncbi:hypothetical protein HMPREF1624_02742 [Sporothrix schenckii ATCC 58251]|uniref:Cas1p 10 TM acyl transferase domain-containing protein n=1 Tax=Sporothrix schenckii (strain ATCC 58251 / de Perez 2211183) TaxID=1391915 RepID=U7Q2V7_SPOS1|nr:hypothetical protein HMPREF1624_02742 [Sporothrix schenckii ATCC 58251]